MGSATTQALTASTAALRSATAVDLGTARELFTAARVLSETPQLSGALTSAAARVAARQKVVADVFVRAAPTTVSLLQAVVGQRWSSLDDLLEGIEELAVRAAAISEPDADVTGELFEVSRLVAAHPELELALGSRLGDASAKGALVDKLLTGRVGAATTVIVSALVQQPRARRVRAMLRWAEDLVASQHGRIVATVFSAVALSDAQLSRLRDALGKKYDAAVSLNVVVDPTVIGGFRVEIGDDVIDATVSSRLGELRQRLAG